MERLRIYPSSPHRRSGRASARRPVGPVQRHVEVPRQQYARGKGATDADIEAARHCKILLRPPLRARGVRSRLNLIDAIWNVVRRQSLSFDINKETEVMKITTIVMATALAISSGGAFAAGGAGGGGAGGAGGGAAGGAAGAAGGTSAGAGVGAASPGVTAPGASSTTPGTTTGTATGSPTGTTTPPGQSPTTPGLNANGPCNGASSTTSGGGC
jgi:hypothetical protein